MSILLSAYFSNGIVFAADKNMTSVYHSGEEEVSVGTLTKVLAWPHQRAVVGFCGLAELASLRMDEWLRVFIAGSRGFEDLDALAKGLTARLESDYHQDFPADAPEFDEITIHLGGFKVVGGHWVPAMYHIRNEGRQFIHSEDVERDFQTWGSTDYPGRTRVRLREMLEERNGFLWYNNGFDIPAFNSVKVYIWELQRSLRADGFLDPDVSLHQLEAYCRIAVVTYGEFFLQHFRQSQCYVGGGVDSVAIPWPEEV